MFELKEYQKDGVKFIAKKLNTQKGVLIGDEMGLGKTIQALHFTQLVIKNKPDSKILIVVPAYLRITWKNEILNLHNGEDMYNRTCIIDRNSQKIPMNKNIYVTGYSNIINANIKSQLKEINFDLCICDESHFLKELTSQRSQSLLPIVNNNGILDSLYSNINKYIFLTGTPFKNGRFHEIFSIMKVSIPDILEKNDCDKYYSFCNRYYQYAMNNGYTVVYGGVNEKNLPEFRDMLKELMIRRTKKEVLKQLPDKIYNYIWLKTDSKLIQYLLEAEEELKKTINVDLIEQLDTKRDQKTVLDHDIMTKSKEFGTSVVLKKELEISKIKDIIKYISDNYTEDNSMRKPIIVCHFRETVKQFEKELSKKYKVVTILGGMSERNRHERKEDFQAGKYDIMVATIESIGIGLTLTASNTMIFAGLLWTPSDLSQVEDRIHRIGQNDKCTYVYFLYDIGIDKYVYENVLMKRKNINKILA